MGNFEEGLCEGYEFIPSGQSYFIIRPHVKEFIDINISEGKDVAIWSAGNKIYVDEIASGFNKNFKFIWNAGTCNKDGMKDLRRVVKVFPEYEKLDIIFYDDNEYQINFNENLGFFCVRVPEFIIGKDDNFFEIKKFF